ncbi:MAG: lamin tail domain-containing protein [archaeon]
MRPRTTFLITALAVLLLPITAALPPGADQLLITTVLANPFEESGSEAVELYNPTDTAIDISGLTIRSESQDADATLPEASIIQPGGYFLIADADFLTDKDDPTWPDADHEETLNLYNSDSGIAIILENTTIDAVGWGDPAEIEDGLYEGTPTNNTDNGHALSRNLGVEGYTDTGDNLGDFSQSPAPSLRSSRPQGSDNETIIGIIAVISGPLFSITEVRLSPDESDEVGVQFFPFPATTRQLLVEADIGLPANYAGTVTVRASMDNKSIEMENIDNLSVSEMMFRGSLPMHYWESPGEHLVEITIDEDTETTGEATFSYMEVAALSIDSETLTFIAEAGMESDIIGDLDASSTSNPTIRNTGNTILDIGLSFSGLSSDSASLPPEILGYTLFSDVFAGSLAGVFSTGMTIEDLDLLPGEDSFNTLSFRLDVPQDTMPGNYSGQVRVHAMPG